MPLSAPSKRSEAHHRVIDMRVFAREDGLYDVEGHLVDRKPFAFTRFSTTEPWPAGQALHDLWVRMTVDSSYTVRAIEAASDTTPHAICKEAERTLSVLVGERIAKGWSSRVKELLRGAASCTHLMEMMIPLATTAMQGIMGMRGERVVDIEANAHKIDSCYAYGRNREVVMRLWPSRWQPPSGP
jgi:Protein of unknown function (DUF2889)